MHRNHFKLLLFVFFFLGCTVTPVHVSQNRIDHLSIELRSLDDAIPPKEAKALSKDIFHETAELTKEFKLTSPPWFHNFLVNIGLREKGLCYQWSDALYIHFLKKHYPHFSFHLGGANIGEYFFEHNVLVVTGKGGKFEEGIVIDPWRDSGKLYFSKLKDDTKYKWKHRANREFCQNGK